MAEPTEPPHIAQRPNSYITVTMDHVSGEIALDFKTRHLDEAMNLLHTAARHVETQWRMAKMAAMQAEMQAQAQVASLLTRTKH